MKLEIRLGAITVLEWRGVVEVPDSTTEEEKDEIVEHFKEHADGGEYKPTDSWDKGDCWADEVDDSTAVTHSTPSLGA